MTVPFGIAEPAQPPDVDVLNERYDIRGMIVEQIPDLEDAVADAMRAQATLVSLILTDQGTHRSALLIYTQASNDFADLLGDLRGGAGRSAMRVSRSLIEHAINLHTVTTDLKEAQRYLEHLDQGPATMLELRVGPTCSIRRPAPNTCTTSGG